MAAYKWKWTATIERETLTALQTLANELGFLVTSPGGLSGRPSPADMLDSLAAAYERDPAAVRLALKVLGVVGEPSADDVRFTSEPDSE